MIERFISNQSSVDGIRKSDLIIPLRFSIFTIVFLCFEGVDVNIRFKTGWTPLMYAAHHLNEPLIIQLLNNGASATSHTPGRCNSIRV